jgi:hypothetical protein
MGSFNSINIRKQNLRALTREIIAVLVTEIIFDCTAIYEVALVTFVRGNRKGGDLCRSEKFLIEAWKNL